MIPVRAVVEGMELTGPGFTWLLRLLLLAVVAGVVVAWPRLAARSISAVVMRLVVLLVVSTFVVLNLVVPVNAYYVWYSSWRDVMNAVTGTAELTTQADVVGAAPGVVLAGRQQNQNRRAAAAEAGTSRDQWQAKATADDGLLTFDVAGEHSGHTGEVRVRLPQGYRKGEANTYPVIVAFHGFPGGWQTLETGLAVPKALAQERGNTVADAIVVMPTWTVNSTDTECVNGGPAGPQVADWLGKDVPQWLRQNFQVADSENGWATLGLSAGGYCALMVTMQNPETFSAAVVLAGYTKPIFEAGYKPFNDTDLAAKPYDLQARAATAPPPVAIWMLAPEPDILAYKPAQEFAQAVHQPTSLTLVTPNVGGHRMDVWRPYVPMALAWLGKHSPAFAPKPTA